MVGEEASFKIICVDSKNRPARLPICFKTRAEYFEWLKTLKKVAIEFDRGEYVSSRKSGKWSELKIGASLSKTIDKTAVFEVKQHREVYNFDSDEILVV